MDMETLLAEGARPRSGPPSRWVDEENFQVKRAIFTDPAIHALEIERIFNRSWLYLGHESEIEAPGQFVTRPMGADKVILIRSTDGEIRAFLNACRHRGAQLCRVDSGTTRAFVCPYHAWTYDSKGALRSTSYDRHYRDLNPVEFGLAPVPRVETYKGLIFGNWDADAVSLIDHLGDLTWYLDILFAQTPEGAVVLGPPQRHVIETNWKIAPLNFMDSQHAFRTHKGPLSMAQAAGAPPLSVFFDTADNSPQVSLPGGHGIVMTSSGPTGEAFAGHPPELIPLYEKTLSKAQFDVFGKIPPSVGTVFPNASWVGNALAVAADEPPRVFLSFRLWQPLGANKIEIWNWYFAPKEASQDAKDAMRRIAVQTFGMGGTFEEDDSEIWATMADAIKGPIASQQMSDFSAARHASPISDPPGPGTYYSSLFGEQAQFAFLRRWNELMNEGGPNASA